MAHESKPQRPIRPPVSPLDFPTEGRFLLAASTGGHLAQLVRMHEQLGATPDSVWVTFDTTQSRSLLRGKPVIYVPYVAPRDWRAVWNARRTIASQLEGERFDGCVSTGAAIAIAAFLSRPARRVPRMYVESVARVNGPSMTGRIVERTHLAQLRTQHVGWANSRWAFGGSVLSSYESLPSEPSNDKPRLFVTLGTIKPYRFDQLVDAVLATGLADSTTVWQLGTTTRDDLPGAVHNYLDADQFQAAAHEADVVITHAGMGTILLLLDMGKYPVVVPRRQSRNEHVDDHQGQIADLSKSEGIAASLEVDAITADAILRAHRRRIVQSDFAR